MAFCGGTDGIHFMDNTNNHILTDYTESLEWNHTFDAELATGINSKYVKLPKGFDKLSQQIASNYLKTYNYFYNPSNGHTLLNTCPYCSGLLEKQQLLSEIKYEPSQSSGWHSYKKYVTFCIACGWWFKEINESLVDHLTQNSQCCHVVHEAIIRKYSLDDKLIPEDTLRKYLLSHPQNLHSIHPESFEKLVAAVYRDYYDCEVRHVGGPNDHGVDVFAIICNEPFLIQVKRRASSTSIESVRTVREFIGTLVEHGASRGHIVTTASAFSRNAKELSSCPNVTRSFVELQLKSIKDVLNMLEITKEALTETWQKSDPSEKPQFMSRWAL